MALDEPRENDETFNEQGIVFLVDKVLFDDVKPISIDFVESAMGAGFMVKSALSDRKNEGCGSGSCSC
jgi:iron-sulfur cluster assembly protein